MNFRIARENPLSLANGAHSTTSREDPRATPNSRTIDARVAVFPRVSIVRESPLSSKRGPQGRLRSPARTHRTREPALWQAGPDAIPPGSTVQRHVGARREGTRDACPPSVVMYARGGTRGGRAGGSEEHSGQTFRENFVVSRRIG